jgi:hypothetical protein
MLGEMARDDSSFDIRGPAGSEVDDEVHGFSLVKRSLCCWASGNREGKATRAKQDGSNEKLH